MTNQARDKAIKSLNYVEGTTLRKKAKTSALPIIKQVLQDRIERKYGEKK